jgi:hypothetical protein
MEPKSCYDPTKGTLPEEDSAPLAAWLTMVVLVLIVICAALCLGAWREHKKKSEAVRAQITTMECNSTSLQPVLSYAQRSRLSSTLVRLGTGFFARVGNAGVGQKIGR